MAFFGTYEYQKSAAEIAKSIESEKQSLAQEIQEGNAQAQDLIVAAFSITALEGKLEAFALADSVTDYVDHAIEKGSAAPGADRDAEVRHAVTRAVTDRVLRGADDSWSAAGPAKHTHFDGLRQAAQVILDHFSS